MKRIQNFINGEYCDPQAGNYIDNVEPATGEVYCQIPDSTEADVAMAVEAAEKAFPVWSGMSGEERGAILMRISLGIEKRMD